MQGHMPLWRDFLFPHINNHGQRFNTQLFHKEQNIGISLDRAGPLLSLCQRIRGNQN